MVLVKFWGTMYLDGQPVKPGQIRNNEQISIGDTVADKEIPFLPWGRGLVTALPICTNVSWNELNEAGFATGKLVKIDGHDFLCRLIQVGQSESAPNEWNDILNVYGRLDTAYWKPGLQFWGQEASPDGARHHLVRGNIFQTISSMEDDQKSALVGFRPFLEPLGPLSTNERHVGKLVRFFGEGGSVTGILKDCDEYDFVVELKREMGYPTTGTFIFPRWIKLIGDDNVAIERTSVVWADLIT